MIKEFKKKNEYLTEIADSVSLYSKDKSNDEQESELEIKISDLESKKTSEPEAQFIDYSNEKELLQNIATVLPEGLNYETLLADYLNQNKTNSNHNLDEYTRTKIEENNTEILSNEEAEETLVDIQYAFAMGSQYQVNNEQRRKFDLWIKLNPVLFSMFESMHAITRDVNYKPF